MLASEILCLIFIGVSFLLFLVAIGIWVDWAWNHRIERAHIIASCIILAVVFLAVVIGAVIGLAVIL